MLIKYTKSKVYSIPIHAWDKHANEYHIDRDPGPDQPPTELFNWNSTRERQQNNNQSSNKVLQSTRKNKAHMIDFAFTISSRKEVKPRSWETIILKNYSLIRTSCHDLTLRAKTRTETNLLDKTSMIFLHQNYNLIKQFCSALSWSKKKYSRPLLR